MNCKYSTDDIKRVIALSHIHTDRDGDFTIHMPPGFVITDDIRELVGSIVTVIVSTKYYSFKDKNTGNVIRGNNAILEHIAKYYNNDN